MNWKNKAKNIGVIIGLMILARGSIYRLTVNYISVGHRTSIALTDPDLIAELNAKIGDRELDIDQIVQIATAITSKRLKFESHQVSRDPNELLKTGQANCIGYAALFNSIADYLLRHEGLDARYKVEHNIGQLNFLGMDLHALFNSPFFKDHDYNRIENIGSGEIILVDPSVHDYLGIGRVSGR